LAINTHTTLLWQDPGNPSEPREETIAAVVIKVS